MSGTQAQMKRWWVVTLCTCLAVVGLSFAACGYRATYEVWNVPVFESPFLDMQAITGSAESLKAGYDPAIENPFDPTHRLFNYPRIWYPFLLLGIGRAGTVPLAVATLALFFLALAVLPKNVDRLTVILLAVTAFSPALMLAYERGNVDLVFFSAVALAVLLVETAPLASCALLAASTLFKVFPFFAVALLLDKDERKNLSHVAGVLGLVLLYTVMAREDLARVFAVTPKGYEPSYGATVIPLFVANVLGKDAHLLTPGLSVLAACLLGAAVVFGLRRSAQRPPCERRDVRAFWAGAGIYTGTFMLGNNWDYRLMFVLLTIPALAVWVRGQDNVVPRITLGALVVSCWYLVIKKLLERTGTHMAFWIDETANWALLAGMAYLLSASMPRWLLQPLGLVPGRAV
jgi:hypothetical protein